MKILLIDTCGAEGSVAIADAACEPATLTDGTATTPCPIHPALRDEWDRAPNPDTRSRIGGQTVSVTLPGRSASEKLVGAVRELATQAGIALRELDAITVINGPGSFTGVRVGLSAAKGLCEALDLPLVAISRLAVLASAANAKSGVPIFAVLDAGRGEFYVGEYHNGAEVREALATRAELAALLAASAALSHAGPELIACEAVVGHSLAEFNPQIVKEPDAAAALPLALRRIAAGAFDNIAAVDANYLRRTDLEIFAKVKTHADPTGKGA